MPSPRKLYSAIGATQDSARAQIAALGPSAPNGPLPTPGQVLTWNGSWYVPTTPAAGGGGGIDFIFDPIAVQDPSKNLYSNWANLCTALAALPFGSLPTVTFARNFAIPSAGMPVGGWFLNEATLRSVTVATGQVTVTVPDGVILDSFGVGNGLALTFSYTGAGSSIAFTSTPPGQPRVFIVSEGAAIANYGTSALIRTPGTGVYTVFASAQSSINAIAPSTAPFVEGNANGADFIIGSQFFAGYFGGLPNGWVIGKGTLIYQNGLDGVIPSTPGWTGTTIPVFQGLTFASRVQQLGADRTFYVSRNGSDVSGDGTLGKPYQTIQAAMTVSSGTALSPVVISCAPGYYPEPWHIKPFVAVVGPSTTSGEVGVVTVNAPNGAVGLDSAAWTAYGVCWLSNLTFGDPTFGNGSPTFDTTTTGTDQVQITVDNCMFNTGATFISDGGGGVNNILLRDSIAYGGMSITGWQFFWTIGSSFLGGTVTVQGGAGANGRASWLAQNTSIGSQFSPTNVVLRWAAPQPVGQPTQGDWVGTSHVGTLTLDGVHVQHTSIPMCDSTSVVLLNGAPQPTCARQISGVGGPNGVVSGSPGDLYTNRSGGAATTLWVKESGVGTNTGWVGK